jgi:hypothetical protein
MNIWMPWRRRGKINQIANIDALSDDSTPVKHVEDSKIYFDLIRDYVKHEDNLINNRISWFINIQSFLIASVALGVSSVVYIFSKSEFSTSSWFLTSFVFIFVCIISNMGAFYSEKARLSIQAAEETIGELSRLWNTYADRSRFPHLPGVAGAGKDVLVQRGSSLQAEIPAYMLKYWKFGSWLTAVIAFVTFVVGVLATPKDMTDIEGLLGRTKQLSSQRNGKPVKPPTPGTAAPAAPPGGRR